MAGEISPAPIEAEGKIKQEKIEKALNRAKTLVESKPVDSLSPRDVADRNIFLAGLDATKDSKQRTFDNVFYSEDTREEYHQQEGIPVEWVLTQLRDEAQKHPDGSAEKTQLQEDASLLADNSKLYHEFPERMGMDPTSDQFVSRIKQEAYFISQDERDQKDEVANYHAAQGELLARRELVMPTEETTKITVDESVVKIDENTLATDPDWQALQAAALTKASSTPAANDVEAAANQQREIDTALQQFAQQHPDIAQTYILQQEAELTELKAAMDRGDIPKDDLDIQQKENQLTQLRKGIPPGTTSTGGTPDTTIRGTKTSETHDVYIIRGDVLSEKRANYVANQLYEKLLTQGRLLSPIKAWRRSLRPFYEHQYRQQIREEMKKANNMYATFDIDNKGNLVLVDAKANSDALPREERAFLELARMQDKGTIDIKGQRVTRLEGDAARDKLHKALVDKVLKPYVGNPGMTPTELQQELSKFVKANLADAEIGPLLKDYFDNKNVEHAKELDYFITDIVEVGNKLREDVQVNTVALEALDQAINIRLADVRQGAQSADQYSLLDRLANNLGKRKSTAWLTNPTLVAASFGIILGSFASNKALAATGIGLTMATPAAILRRRFEAVRERSTQNLRQVYGDAKPLPKDVSFNHIQNPLKRKAYEFMARHQLKNQERLDATIVKKASVNQLLEGTPPREVMTGDTRGLNELMAIPLKAADTESDAKKIEAVANRDALANRIAEITARLDATNELHQDYISYDGFEKQGQNLLSLTQKLLAAKQLLRTSLTPAEYDTAMDQVKTDTIAWGKQLKGDKDAALKSFRNYQIREYTKTAFMTVATGTITGEALALLGREAGLHVQQTAMEATAHKFADWSTMRQGENTAVQFAHQHGLEKLLPHQTQQLPHEGGGIGQGLPPLDEIPRKQVGVDLNVFKNAYTHPGTVDLGSGYKAIVNNDHSVLLADSRGMLDHQPSIQLQESGSFLVTGDIGPLKEQLEKLGFSVNMQDGLITRGPDTTILQTGSTIHQIVNGHDTQIPYGTHWESTEGQQWQLVADSDPNKTIITSHFDANGNMVYDNYDSTLISHTDSVEINKNTGTHTITEHRDLIGTTEKPGEWISRATPVEHREWYSYDRPGSQGNELRLHTQKEGDSVILDIRGMMLGYQNGLNPNPIDVQQVIKNHQAGFAFSLPGHEDLPIWIPDDADGTADGLLHLDPNDYTHKIHLANGSDLWMGDFAKLVVNQNALAGLPDGDIATELYHHEGVFRLAADGKMGFIEAGRLVNEDGKTTLQAFATIRGNAPMATGMDVQIEVPNAPVEVHKDVITLLKDYKMPGQETKTPQYLVTPPTIPTPPATPTPPPLTGPAERGWDVPIPVLPFAPRAFVDRMKANELIEIPYYSMYGGDGISEEVKAALNTNRSQTLKDNPDAILDLQTEAQIYFDKQKPEYLAEVKRLSEQVTDAPSSNLKMMICIPVAGHQEGDNIYTSLQNYTYQDAPTDQFELVLFVNHPVTDKSGNPINPDKTMAEIERFKRDYPDFPVRVISKILPLEEANIGTVRKYLNDVALYRQMQRGATTGDVILVSNDADNKGVAPTYVSNFIRRFEENPQVDGILGQLDWDPEAYTKYPLVHLGTRLFQYLNAIGRRNSNRMVSSGANFAFKGSMYAAVGGYLNTVSGGEDIAIGQGITLGRDDITKRERIAFGGAAVSRLYTSARRSVNSVMNGIAPINQWEKGFSAFDDEVRKMQLNSGADINYDDPMQVATIQLGLEKILNQTLDSYEKGEKLGKDSQYYRKALRYMGIRYTLRDGQIQITNMDQLAKQLQHYQAIGVLLRDIKSGKDTPEAQTELKRLQDQYEADLNVAQTETAKEKEEEDKVIDAELSEFEKEKVTFTDLPPLKYTLDELKASAKTQEEGDYVLCYDRPIGSAQTATMVAGYNKTTGQLLAFKIVKKKDQEKIAEMNKYKDDAIDPEDAIKRDISNPILGVYLDKLDKGEDLIKVYPLKPIDLAGYLEDHVLSPEDALAITIKLAQGVRSLHQHGFLYLDITDHNMMLDNDGISLIDFNIASTKKGKAGRYVRGFTGGNPWVRPPEMFERDPALGESADTYQAAIFLYRRYTGHYPYNVVRPTNPGLTEQQIEADIMRQHRDAHIRGDFTIPDTIPESVKQILERGMQSDPLDRYQSMNEMLTDLLEAYKTLKATPPIT